MTAVRLVQDWEPNTCCHLSECLSVCQSARLPAWIVCFLTSDRFLLSNLPCLLIWFWPLFCARLCVCVSEWEKPNVQALQVCVCVYLRGSQYGMRVLARICPADWVLVKHFQMLATEIRMWLLKPEKIWLTKRKKKRKRVTGKKKISLLAEREMSLSIIYIQIMRVPPN